MRPLEDTAEVLDRDVKDPLILADKLRSIYEAVNRLRMGRIGFTFSSIAVNAGASVSASFSLDGLRVNMPITVTMDKDFQTTYPRIVVHAAVALDAYSTDPTAHSEASTLTVWLVNAGSGNYTIDGSYTATYLGAIVDGLDTLVSEDTATEIA